MDTTLLVMNSLVALPIVIAMAIGFVWGGCKFGHLQKRIEVDVDKEGLPTFFDRMNARLAELGFRQGSSPDEFLQGGHSSAPVNAAQFTHANTLKLLSVSTAEVGTGTSRAVLALGYLKPIAMDTGETAYLDAVLNYVSGQCDRMTVVANRSFFAFSSFVGGICAWISLVVLRSLHFHPIKDVMMPNSAAFLTLGVLAVVGIRRKPLELSGLRFAIIGIIASAAALVFVLVR